MLDGRQPTEREAAAAVGGPATSQDGVWIRLASFRSSDEPGPAHGLLCQFGLAGLVSAGRRTEAARLGRFREGPLGPTSVGPSAAAAACWGATPSEGPWCVRGLVLFGALGHLPAGAAPALRCQVADAPDPTTARPFPALGGVEPLWLEA